MDFQNFFFDLSSNLFLFFTLEGFTLSFFQFHHPKQKSMIRFLFLSLHLCFAIIPHIAYFPLVYAVTCFLYVYWISSGRLKSSFIFFMKYVLFYSIVLSCSVFFCELMNINALPLLLYDKRYSSYQSLTEIILVYIFISLHSNTRRLRKLHIRTLYPAVFFALPTAVIFLLLFLNKIFSQYEDMISVIPYIYLCMISILVLSLDAYRKIIESMETQTAQKFSIQKYEMELACFQNVQDSLRRLAKLRHDFKNQLIVLDSYASQQRITELRSYIKKMNTELTETKLFDTPNSLISSILNTKQMLCREKGIHFSVICEFTDLQISDFAIITILGNILDNAIRAASAAANGFVELSLSQTDGYFDILCHNNYTGTIIEKNGTFTSTKEDNKELHGFGIRNVKDCAASLRGICDIEYNNHDFYVKIMIPNY